MKQPLVSDGNQFLGYVFQHDSLNFLLKRERFSLLHTKHQVCCYDSDLN